MTRSTGTSGLAFLGSAPIFLRASRMAARSTTQGTPVKSCKTTRAGRKLISHASALVSHFATYSMSERLTVAPSSKRSRFSRRILIE